MSAIRKDRRGIEVDAKGYAFGFGCYLNHSGNDRYVHHSGGQYECQGCGNFVHASTIHAVQAGAKIDMFGNIRGV